LFAGLEGKGAEGFGKKGASGRNRGVFEEMTLGVHFSS